MCVPGAAYILRLMWRPRLALQVDLSSKALDSGILLKNRYCIVVEVVDEVPNSCLMGCSQLIRYKKGAKRGMKSQNQ